MKEKNSIIKRVYKFGDKHAEGKAEMKNLLGGKGANLAEMNLIGVPVPPGFTITTDVCTEYNKIGEKEIRDLLKTEVEEGIRHIEKIMGTKFGDKNNPCLVSVRSGARVSMPGMMDTVLNLGLNDYSVQGLAKKTKNERFAYDSYRRFIQMYSNVVLGVKEEEDPFEELITKIKELRGLSNDTDLSTDDLNELVYLFKFTLKKLIGKEFPDDPWEQLWGAIIAVFNSWNTERAVLYRKLNDISDDWGTAVNVQAMVYGNMGNNSATGVAFTRDAATGEDLFNGEYLINAQGEDVVAGIRTPRQITKEGSQRWAKLINLKEDKRKQEFASLEETMPSLYKELFTIQKKLEMHYKDMQDIEFTIQEGKLWLLQTRNGKRTGEAMVKIAVDMLKNKLIDEKTAILRMEPVKIGELLHPVFAQEAMKKAVVITNGLPASPGAATGRIVFFAEDAESWAAEEKPTILVRVETSPEDLKGMNAARGILTARGGMTSHAAVVARGMGKCCVSGAGALQIDYRKRFMEVKGKKYKEGDWISLNGATGEVYDGRIQTIIPEVSGDFGKLMKLTNKFSRLYVRTNADSPKDSKVAREFGAKGIGLCRTEHMFFEGNRIKAMREMILASDERGRRRALDKLLPIQRQDFEGIFEVMHDLPVTIRLLDPPLHEFVPHGQRTQEELAHEMGISLKEVQQKIKDLEEFNPMLGHRGCRLGNTYPEITEMQTRAIIEAALNLKSKGINAIPEIMVPLISTADEFRMQEKIIRSVANQIFKERNDNIDFLVGTMIEIPRAALRANHIAVNADFFSFGTNDLTQMTYGFSRDDAGKFMPIYLDKGLLRTNPFQAIDQEGVGQLLEIAIERGRGTKKELKIGICGEHGGEPSSVEFCHRIGMDYVSCSPYRVPIARLAAAQAALKYK